jgi:hypothetical protein
MSQTEYIVLRRTADGVSTGPEAYEVVGAETASSPEAAARAVALDGNTGGDYIAVPKRNFAVIPVEIVNERRAVVKGG